MNTYFLILSVIVYLVPLEDCKFRQTVLRKGKLLYAKQGKSAVAQKLYKSLKDNKMKRIFFCTLAVVLFASSHLSAARKNRALLLFSDHDSFFEAPDNPAFHTELNNVFTVEAWIFQTRSQAGERMIVNKEDSYEIAVRAGDLFQSAINVGAGWNWHDSGIRVKLEEWTHVAVTWQGETMNMYVNGKRGAKGIPPFPTVPRLNTTDSTFKVGRRVRGESNPKAADTHSIFDGLIDEVRVSKRVRYKEKEFVVPRDVFDPDNDTTALYHFDEEVDGRIKDFSKNQVDGQLVGKAVLIAAEIGEPLEIDFEGILHVEAEGKLATLWGKLKIR